MIEFGNDYIDRLNRTYKGGKWLKAVILTENPEGPVLKYKVDHEESIVFQGNTYEPLHMRWDNIKTSHGMPTEGATISVSNITSEATNYVKQVDISGNQIIIQLLHLDLLSTLTSYWQRKYKVLGVQADVRVATFTVGRQLGRNRLPRKVFLRDQFKGLTSDVPRIF